MITASKALRIVRKSTLICMIFLGLFAGCAAAGLTGCTLNASGSAGAADDAGPELCAVCVGPQYPVAGHVECLGTWVDEPCEVAARSDGGLVQ